ncbi:MAG: hypothetical protein AAFY57_16265 [Cyanobacteria bacterium J06642_2]
MPPHTSGLIYEEVIANAQDCIEACLEHWQEEGIQPPSPEVMTAVYLVRSLLQREY